MLLNVSNDFECKYRSVIMYGVKYNPKRRIQLLLILKSYVLDFQLKIKELFSRGSAIEPLFMFKIFYHRLIYHKKLKKSKNKIKILGY